VRYLSKTEKRHWDQIKKQFPYQYNSMDMAIALCGGVLIGLMVGVLFGYGLGLPDFSNMPITYVRG